MRRGVWWSSRRTTWCSGPSRCRCGMPLSEKCGAAVAKAALQSFSLELRACSLALQLASLREVQRGVRWSSRRATWCSGLSRCSPTRRERGSRLATVGTEPAVRRDAQSAELRLNAVQTVDGAAQRSPTRREHGSRLATVGAEPAERHPAGAGESADWPAVLRDWPAEHRAAELQTSVGSATGEPLLRMPSDEELEEDEASVVLDEIRSSSKKAECVLAAVLCISLRRLSVY